MELAMSNVEKELVSKILHIIKQEKVTLEEENVTNILTAFSEALEKRKVSKQFISIKEELERIERQIKVVKEEIVASSPDQISDQIVPQATSELNAVTKVTEKSTNAILDYAEQIQSLTKEISNENVLRQINDNIIKIFEACDFQDLTGQRISKVIKMLIDVEGRIEKLKMYSSNTESSGADDSDAKLMNGPQPEGLAPSQAQIDDLFQNIPINKSSNNG